MDASILISNVFCAEFIKSRNFLDKSSSKLPFKRIVIIYRGSKSMCYVKYVAIIALFDMLIYPSFASCFNVYAQEPEIRYKQQLGSKGSENGQFRTPHSLAVDIFGNIYIGDTGNKRIEKFYPNGTFVTSWGSAGSNDGQFLVCMTLQ
jgi:hypothetical protein